MLALAAEVSVGEVPQFELILDCPRLVPERGHPGRFASFSGGLEARAPIQVNCVRGKH